MWVEHNRFCTRLVCKGKRFLSEIPSNTPRSNQDDAKRLKLVCREKSSGGHFAKYWGGGGGGENFNMYAFGVGLKYANLSNIMLGISNSFFENTNSSFENTNSSFENTNSSFKNTNSTPLW